MADIISTPEQSNDYHKFRLRFPKHLYEIIDQRLLHSTNELPAGLKEKFKKNPQNKWNLALDVGCGTGISTTPLVDFVQETFGIDASETQIFKAKVDYGNKDPSRVTYLCERATEISHILKEGTCDLITVGQAIHWFDRPKFYEICMGLLRTGGMVAIYGYSKETLLDEKAEMVKNEYYHKLGEWMKDSSNKLDENHLFDELKKTFPKAERDKSMHRIKSCVESTVDEYIGYLSTWTAYRKYKGTHPEHPDILDELKEKLKATYPGEGQMMKRMVEFFLITVLKEL